VKGLLFSNFRTWWTTLSLLKRFCCRTWSTCFHPVESTKLQCVLVAGCMWHSSAMLQVLYTNHMYCNRKWINVV